MLWTGQLLSDTGTEIGRLAYPLPAIVADGQLEEAWAATEARDYAASLAGPALGGLLFGLGRAVPFLADAVS